MQYQNVQHLAVWHHASSQTPKARVLLIHGLSEHSGRHVNTVNYLSKQGFEVVRFDLRGTGHSGGRRNWIERFSDYVSDTGIVFHWIDRELAPLPLFLMGHSLGGAIAAHFASIYQHSLRGLVLSAPAYLPGSGISPTKIWAARVLRKLLPKLPIPSESIKGLSRDPEVEKNYALDPLCNHRNTVQQGYEILMALPLMPEVCSRIQIPTLIIHGSLDCVVKLEGSFELLQRLKAQDHSLYIIPGGYHEPHNDTDKENTFQFLSQWLSRIVGLNVTDTFGPH